MLKLKGLATGLGSLPQKDGGRAVELVLEYFPNMPFWPQLPKRDIREGMINQYSEGFPFLKMTPSGLIFCASEAEGSSMEEFYSRIIADDAQSFKISQDFAAGLYGFREALRSINLYDLNFIKCQTTGPFTFAAGIHNDKGVELLHDKEIFQAIVKGLALKSVWQIDFFREFDKKTVLFIDEPYLSSFGSAYVALNKADVVGALTDFAGILKRQHDILLGVHCCGNTDWSMLTEIKGLDIINFDAFEFMEKFTLYGSDIKKFIDRGGLICWGIVPTQLYSAEVKPDLLIRKLKEGINALTKTGLGEDELWEKMLISPSCGMGTFTADKTEKILNLLKDTSLFLQKYP